MAVDNLMRRALRIQDPHNADQVAKALLSRYADEAAKIKRERDGLPFVVTPAMVPALATIGSAQGIIRGAMDSLERTLSALLNEVQLADILSELRGWATQIRRAAADGVSAARFALDPNERDRAFAARVTLGEFARLARYTGAVTACAQPIYCRLAQGCDYIANLILIAIGDALIDAGVTRSAAIPQVPAATLRSRRDQIMTGLQHLMMTPSADADQDDWPRGTIALDQLYTSLEQAGAPDLRAFLDEGYLSRELDDMIDLATGATPDGLRALGATAPLTVQRLARFVSVAQRLVAPPSPPLTVFLSAIQLFIRGFATTNAGYRLPYLSRSPLLIAGISPNATTDDPTFKLLALANLRSTVAQAADCFCCSCDDDDSSDLIVAGKALFDIDRAIDLYALGTNLKGDGDAEIRAAAFGAVALAARKEIKKPGTSSERRETKQIRVALDAVATTLRWPRDTEPGDPPPVSILNILDLGHNTVDPRVELLHEVLCAQARDEVRWTTLVASLAPMCQQALLLGHRAPVARVLRKALGRIEERIGFFVDPVIDEHGVEVEFKFGPCPSPDVRIPAPVETSHQRFVRDENAEMERFPFK
jgi:hypothetical protein